jgi:hypothetical protein
MISFYEFNYVIYPKFKEMNVNVYNLLILSESKNADEIIDFKI